MSTEVEHDKPIRPVNMVFMLNHQLVWLKDRKPSAMKYSMPSIDGWALEINRPHGLPLSPQRDEVLLLGRFMC